MPATIDEYNVLVNGVPLINSWRKTTTQIVTSRDARGVVKNAGIEFVIQGTDETDLATKKRVTEREFNQLNPVAYGYRTADGSGGVNRLFDYSLGDGESLRITSSVSDVPQDALTEYSRYMYLEVLCEMSGETPPGGIPTPGEDQEDIPGMKEPLIITTVYESGDTKTIGTEGVFYTDYEPTSVGPLTITDVDDNGVGKARITLSGNYTLPNGSYVVITGTTYYNGRWKVTAGSGTAVIDIDSAYLGTESSGTLSGGEITTALQQYEAAKETIYGLLGVGANNITIVHKFERENGDGTFEFTMNAQEQAFVPGGEQDDDSQLVRSILLRVLPKKVQEWEKQDLSSIGGTSTVPSTVVVEGSVVLNRRNLTAELIDHWTAELQAEVLTRIAAAVGADITTLDVQSIDLAADISTPAIGFTISLWGNYNNVMAIEYTRGVKIPHDAFIYAKGVLHGIQFKKSEDIHVITRTFMRLGDGIADLSALGPPVETGYYFHLHEEDDSQRGPLAFDNDIGDNIYRQIRNETWFRLKLV